MPRVCSTPRYVAILHFARVEASSALRVGGLPTREKSDDAFDNLAPLVWLHSDDPFKPSDLLAHVRHTTPTRDGKAIADLPSLDLDNLEILNDFRNDGDEVFLASNDDPLTYPDWIRGESPDADGRIRGATPCVVILVDKGPRDLDAFYFYFYSFNEGPNITQVLEPINWLVSDAKLDSGWHFGNHVGDWFVT